MVQCQKAIEKGCLSKMITDKEFFQWIHDLLINHGEDKNSDYMYKLRAIIEATPEEQVTPNVVLIEPA